ncbi:MAG: hypothetical protein A3D31_17470 [Candidatus Fluviicola riflensis]|nr:MAG: hypothetical protein CHH17_02410 [Candidatus Fluviicola riflensis]OGS76774.1 MAG: hypothetical protein A3D31_17470 [Candidatus Fluviicola riflensis]OGS82871.1 MAG: hypothetical protein A2724_13890 [Fluviicola sp. RIFCSPHIGHO2_01_FULL_43_53]OGS88504.1 MAG: hypothetical protein A3E30_06975 [Fluviicola sp. RIFCSPHIGHO2_12_FULL_43_24]
MITLQNIAAKMKKADASRLSRILLNQYNSYTKKTKNWRDLSDYDNDPIFRGKVDKFIVSLNRVFGGDAIKTKALPVPPSVRRTSTKKAVKSTRKISAPKKRKPSVKQPKPKVPFVRLAKKYAGDSVERISEELRFIKRFVLMNGKSKKPEQLRSFLNSLQRAITEKRIRKTSKYAKQIIEIQDELIALLAKAYKYRATIVRIDEQRRSEYLALAGKQRLLPSIRFIKSFISMQGKRIEVARAKTLITRIDRAYTNKSMSKRDPYHDQINDILARLNDFVKRNKVDGFMQVPSRELNGLGEIVDDVEGISGLNGFSDGGDWDGDDYDDQPATVVRGRELAQMHFPTLGFRGKWLDFIGDPTQGFTAMVFGRPKFGKSALCIEFADYLSKNHGEVLYVAREEHLSGTLQKKVQHSRAYEVNYSGSIPADLSRYDFVFLDSITKLGLTAEDLDDLRDEYPKVSFIFIFQTTKQGAFRGSNGYQHDVDIVIEIPEIGQARQYGRFNAGAEMDFFKESYN